MNKTVMGLLALVFSVSVQAANVLHVKAGQSRILEAGRQEWVLDELVLEDGATLVVPGGTSQIQIDAARVVIGKDARIVAVGTAGKPGGSGANSSGQAEKCEAGIAGGQGSHGSSGADGVTLSMTLRIAALGSLLIDTRGGDGGAGGDGGLGQAAGEFETCSAPSGGEGGPGGDGGNGGNGGLVRLLYTLLPESGISGGLGEHIKVTADGGKGAAGGVGGKGGAGSPGKFINMKTLSGSRKWVGGGKPGLDGSAGKPGQDGAKGQVLLQQDLRSRMDEMVQQQAEPDQKILNQEVDALKGTAGALATQEMLQKQSADQASKSATMEQTLQQILKRLDALEQKVSKLSNNQAPASP